MSPVITRKLPIPQTADEKILNWTEWKVVGSGALIQVHPGVAIPSIVRAGGPLSSVPSGERGDSAFSEGFHLDIEASYGQALGHYTLRSFSVVAPENEEVTGVLLRTLTPLAVLRWILPRTFQLEASALSVSVTDFVAPELKRQRIETPNEKSAGIDLADVGTVYRLAAIVRYPPAKAVAETFGLEARTATNWIARARAVGLT